VVAAKCGVGAPAVAGLGVFKMDKRNWREDNGLDFDVASLQDSEQSPFDRLSAEWPLTSI